MKKFFCFIFCIILCTLSACSPNNGTAEFKPEHREIIDSGEYYRIYKDAVGHVGYDIYDLNGDIVLSEKTDRPLRINMLNDDTVHIEIGMGTGISIHRYYSAMNKRFSREFTYVLSNSDSLVAYIDVPKDKSFKNRKLVVQNIFNSDLYYKEFLLDFSNVDTPVVEAELSANEASLQLTYLSGKERTRITTALDLT